MSPDTLVALFLLVHLLMPILLLPSPIAPDSPDNFGPYDPNDLDSYDPDADSDTSVQAAWQATVGLVGSGFKTFGRFGGRLLGYTPTNGSLDTGGAPTGRFFGFGTANKNESAAYFVRELAGNPRIKALGKAAEPFVISPGKDKEAVDGIQAVYEAMTTALIEQDRSLSDEATFFGHLLAWRCTGTITASNLQTLNGAGERLITKETDEDLNRFLALVNQPRVQDAEFSPVLAETVDPSSIMEEVIDIFNATDAHETDRLSDAEFENVLVSRSALVATLTDPLSLFGPSPMLSLGAIE